jgi:succinoglycan biosynthesis protein ExoA
MSQFEPPLRASVSIRFEDTDCRFNMPQSTKAIIPIAVPTLNEEAYIVKCLHSLLRQASEDQLQIMVLDGGSADRTIELVESLRVKHHCISIVHNPKHLQSAAVNLAAVIADSRASVFFRADAHAEYPPNFVRDCLQALEGPGVTSVVVPMRTVGSVRWERAIAAAQNSLLGNGGAAHRIGGRSGFVDHGHHAAFDRRFFLEIGGYNETFSHNEDAEFDYRAIRAGGRIWMCAEAAITYFPKRQFGALARQYYWHGRGRARTLLTHRLRPKMRQVGPLLALFAAFGGALLAPVHWLFGLLPLSYVLLCHIWGLLRALAARDPWVLGMGPACMTMHLSWSAGFVGALGLERFYSGTNIAHGGTRERES